MGEDDKFYFVNFSDSKTRGIPLPKATNVQEFIYRFYEDNIYNVDGNEKYDKNGKLLWTSPHKFVTMRIYNGWVFASDKDGTVWVFPENDVESREKILEVTFHNFSIYNGNIYYRDSTGTHYIRVDGTGEK
jgi:hypothetical protein